MATHKSVQRIIREEAYVQHIASQPHGFHDNKRSRAGLPYSIGITDKSKQKLLQSLTQQGRIEKTNNIYTTPQETIQ